LKPTLRNLLICIYFDNACTADGVLSFWSFDEYIGYRNDLENAFLEIGAEFEAGLISRANKILAKVDLSDTSWSVLDESKIDELLEKCNTFDSEYYNSSDKNLEFLLRAYAEKHKADFVSN